jgi:hypothetical protein
MYKVDWKDQRARNIMDTINQYPVIPGDIENIGRKRGFSEIEIHGSEMIFQIRWSSNFQGI